MLDQVARQLAAERKKQQALEVYRDKLEHEVETYKADSSSHYQVYMVQSSGFWFVQTTWLAPPHTTGFTNHING